MSDVGRVGAEKRRRDRQLRTFHRHEQFVGANGAGDGPPPQRSTPEVKSGEKYVGLRAQKPPGEAAGSLSGARAAGEGSHGRVRGCPDASSCGAVDGWG